MLARTTQSIREIKRYFLIVSKRLQVQTRNAVVCLQQHIQMQFSVRNLQKRVLCDHSDL